MTLHRFDVYRTDDGVGIVRQFGEAVEFDGQRMVRLGHGVLVPAKGWHESEDAAKAAAAARIAAIAEGVLSKIGELIGGTA